MWGIDNADGTRPNTVMPAVILQRCEAELKPQANCHVVRFCRQQFKQDDDETMDNFIYRWHQQASKCKFKTLEVDERIIEQFIV